MINPSTGQEDPNYVDPNTGIINSNLPATSTTPETGVGTTNLSTGSVSDQLDQILGPSTTSTISPSATTVPGATNWNVTPEQTVEGRIGGIINSNSPLMAQAKARSTEAANSRGLINSSMAVQAGEAALYDAALPIAQQDANTFATSAQSNATETNKMNMQLIDDQNKIQLANINTSYQGLVAANEGAAQLYDTYQKAINVILTNPDMDAANKQAAINAQLGMMQAGMAMYSGIEGLNLNSLLDFGGTDTATGGAGNDTVTGGAPSAAGAADQFVADNSPTSLVGRQAAWDAQAKILKPLYDPRNNVLDSTAMKMLTDRLGPRPT